MSVSFSDIAQLNLDEPDQLDWNQYKDAQATADPVDDGIYDVQAPEEILFDVWEKDGKKYLRIANETKALTIQGGPSAGRKLFYPFTTNRKYQKTMGSAFGDYLRSFGITAQPNSQAEYASLAQATANRIGKVQTKQEAYCKDCNETVAERQVNVAALRGKCPSCGGAVKVSAKVDRWLSTVPR